MSLLGKTVCCAAPCVLVALAAGPATGATIYWDGEGGSNMNWSAAANWNPDTNDANNNSAVFGNAAVTNAQGVVNNVVNADYTLSSLIYNQTNLHHATRINSGRTLSVNGAFETGIPAANPGTSAVTLISTVTIASDAPGAGALVVNAGANNIVIGPTDSAYDNGGRVHTLDLKDLGGFTASTLNYFYLGSGHRDPVTLYLAASNRITAGRLTLGCWNSCNSLYLGSVNVMNVGQITLCGDVPGGAQINNGTNVVQFRGGLTNPVVTIRGTNGIGRADITVGMGGNKNGFNFGVLDLSGGGADIMAGVLIVGQGYPAPNDGADGRAVLTFGAGTIDATNLTVGYTATGTRSNNVGRGTLNVLGPGTLIADTLTVADQQGSASVTGTVNLLGGTLKAAVIRRGGGPGAAFFNWEAGVIQNRGDGTNLVMSGDLPLTVQGASNHAFYAGAGSTITVYGVIGSAAGGTGQVVKAGGGALVLNGTNICAAPTVVSNGVLSGTGTVAGTLTVKSGAGLAPGDATGTLTVRSNLVLEAGSTLAIRINSADDYGRLTVTNGTISLGLAELTASAGAARDAKFWIVNNRTAMPVSGTFGTIPEGGIVHYNSDYESQSLSGGNDVLLYFPHAGTVLTVR